MQKLITQPGPLINANGIATVGYSTHSVLNYNPNAMKTAPWRLKEWDFYQVSDNEKCMQFTIGHTSYAGSISAMFFTLDGTVREERTKMLVLPFKSVPMPTDTEKDHVIGYKRDDMNMRFTVKGDRRILRCKAGDLEAEIALQRQNPHSIVITVPFDEDKYAFYYNHKINCMTAKGTIRVGGKEYVFNEAAYGLLDWGRGVWPFSHQWYWSNGTGMVDGQMFGFNLGCGFGNTSQATENIVFYAGKAHKLGSVAFELAGNGDYMQPWRIYEEDGRLDLEMTPIYDRVTATKLLFVNNKCHQVFGRFNGYVTLDDGTHLEINDIVAFAEHAVNRW